LYLKTVECSGVNLSTGILASYVKERNLLNMTIN